MFISIKGYFYINKSLHKNARPGSESRRRAFMLVSLAIPAPYEDEQGPENRNQANK